MTGPGSGGSNAQGSGGATSAGGRSGQGGASGASGGANPGTGGASGSTGGSVSPTANQSGCSCAVGDRGDHSAGLFALFAAAILAVRVRRRNR